MNCVGKMQHPCRSTFVILKGVDSLIPIFILEMELVNKSQRSRYENSPMLVAIDLITFFINCFRLWPLRKLLNMRINIVTTSFVPFFSKSAYTPLDRYNFPFISFVMTFFIISSSTSTFSSSTSIRLVSGIWSNLS